MAATVALFTYSNADFVSPFQYQDGAGNPVDISGWSLRLMVRRTAADARAWASVASPDKGIGINDAVNGRFTLTLAKAVLAAMPAGGYVHDLVATKPNGTTETMWIGSIMHALGVTR